MKTNWQTKKLGDIVGITSGTWGPADNQGTAVLRSTNFTNEGNIIFDDIAYREIPENKISELNLKRGDILLEKSGGSPAQPVGRVVLFDKEQEGNIVFGNFISRLRPSGINNKFLFYFLLHLYKKGYTNRLQNQTTGIRNLILKKYLDIKVPIPTITIQQQIVERLDAIRKLQELNDKEIEKAEEFFDSLLISLLRPRQGWQIKKLSEVTENLDSKRVPIDAGERNKKTGTVPYYGANGQIGWIDDYLFNEPLLLVAEDGGNWGPLKNSSYVITGKSWVNNHAHVLRCGDVFTLKYLNYYLNFKDLRKYISGTTRGKLNQKALNSIDVLLPPDEVKLTIVERLNEIRDCQTNFKKQKEELSELFENVLNKVMKGKLTN